MLDLLKKHFGYNSFRPGQERIISEVMAGNDALVLMPTGGGKSLCYQLPALKYKGLTLVISPLISLMKDQVDLLKENGIPAAFLNSSLSKDEQNAICGRILNGEVKLLYLAPERLTIETFRLWLQKLNISLIAIDEAHCISEWGHDFRPDYRTLTTLKSDFQGVPIIALTATATHSVRRDILSQLEINSNNIYISSFNRPNLTYRVEPKQKTFQKLLSLLEDYNNEPVIIYCFSRKNTESLSEKLQANGFNAHPYHAGLNPKKRQETQEKFVKDKIQIIVATIAFGMGINKPDVRLIVHYDMPKSVEGYYQETGRAGRDGLPAECILFYSYSDAYKHRFFIDRIASDSERKNAEEKLAKIINFCKTTACRRRYLLKYFGENYQESGCEKCDICSPKTFTLKDSKQKSKGKKNIAGYDELLFEKLRALRKNLADAANVPPFIIFSNVSLQEMALYFPQTPQEFSKITGVGNEKLSRFGEDFIACISRHLSNATK